MYYYYISWLYNIIGWWHHCSVLNSSTIAGWICVNPPPPSLLHLSVTVYYLSINNLYVHKLFKHLLTGNKFPEMEVKMYMDIYHSKRLLKIVSKINLLVEISTNCRSSILLTPPILYMTVHFFIPWLFLHSTFFHLNERSNISFEIIANYFIVWIFQIYFFYNRCTRLFFRFFSTQIMIYWISCI